MNAGILKQVIPESLNPHEWNFKSVPQAETEACYLYEAAREFFKISKHLQKLRNKWCRHRKTNGIEAHLAWLEALDLLQTGCKNFPDINFKYFPDVAWLDLPKLTRISAAEYVNERSARHQKRHSDRLHIETLRECEPPKIRTMEVFRHYHEFFHDIFSKQNSGNTEYGFFAVNWDFKDAQIIEAFKHWLKKQRGTRQISGFKEAKPPISRGGFKDKLSRLGALRLKRRYRKSQLVNYDDTYLKLNAPYRHISDLYDAAKRAKQEIARLFPNDWDESAWWRQANQQPKIKAQLPEFLKK